MAKSPKEKKQKKKKYLNSEAVPAEAGGEGPTKLAACRCSHTLKIHFLFSCVSQKKVSVQKSNTFEVRWAEFENVFDVQLPHGNLSLSYSLWTV